MAPPRWLLPDHRVDLVDEHDGAGTALDLLDDRLQPLLEIAAIARAGQQGPHVKLENRALFQHFRNVPLMIFRARPSAMAVLPTPGSPTKSGLFFLPAAQDLDGAVDFLLAADQRIDLALAAFLLS